MPRIAIVTGGTRGIGEAISVALKARGHIVIAGYGRDDDRAKAFSDRTSIPALKWEVTDPSACEAACRSIATAHGAPAILVNNAGITRDASFMKMTPQMWSAVIDTDLTACFNMSKAVFGDMRNGGWGRIVNIGSVNGQCGQFGQVNYSAAKAGLTGFTRSLAKEGAKYGITANVVAPGYTQTDMVDAVPPAILDQIRAAIPTGRLCRPEEVAHSVAFLCDDQSSQITGSTISINGGYYLG